MPRLPKVKKLGIILKPTESPFERRAVLNPGCIQEGEYVHLFYRAIDSSLKSSIGYAKLKGPTKIVERWKRPIITRDYSYESHGVEDPRLVKIRDTYYMTYVAHDGKNALTAYATSRDLKKFSKKGIISPRIKYHDAETIFEREDLKDAYILFSSYYENREGHDVLLWHKDFILFPKKIRGNFVALHRVLPDIQIVSFRNFSTLTNEFWKREFRNFSKRVVLQNTHWFETRNIGGGAVPLETKKGWIVIYHGVEETNAGRIYHASAILLDLNDPRKVIGKLHSPLFSPTKPWEKKGLVPNIVFPTANAVFNNTLYIYYSAADSLIAVAAVNLNSLLRELLNPKRKHNNNEE